MHKVIVCREVGFDCAGVVEAADLDAALAAVAAHAAAAHGITEVTPDLLDRVLAVVHDAAPAQPAG